MGLEEIGMEAFARCALLHCCITIPPAGKEIDDSRIEEGSNQTKAEFCNKIIEFMSCKASQDWWIRLNMYCFLVRHSIPDRLGLFLVRRWWANIYKMLRCEPFISHKGWMLTLIPLILSFLNKKFGGCSNITWASHLENQNEPTIRHEQWT